MIASLPLVLEGIQAAITLAPGVVSVVESCQQLIASLFEAGVITAEEQNRLHAWVDGVQAAVLAGSVPPSFVVEPDPE